MCSFVSISLTVIFKSPGTNISSMASSHASFFSNFGPLAFSGQRPTVPLTWGTLLPLCSVGPCLTLISNVRLPMIMFDRTLPACCQTCGLITCHVSFPGPWRLWGTANVRPRSSVNLHSPQLDNRFQVTYTLLHVHGQAMHPPKWKRCTRRQCCDVTFQLPGPTAPNSTMAP